MDGNDHDDLLTSLIIHAREYCESFQNRKIPTQTVEVYLDEFPQGSIIFDDCSPVQSVESIKYIDIEGTEHTLEPSVYALDNMSFLNKISLAYGKVWPAVNLPVNGVKITFVAGYEVVPETIKWAMVLQMKLLYDDYKPEERIRVEKARDSLLSMNRVVPA